MLFKKTFGELVQESLVHLKSNTSITNTNIGGITRSIIEIINRNIADYYDVLDINMAMCFLSSAEGYFLDLIGYMFNMERTVSSQAAALASDNVQKFYVATGTLFDKVPSGFIPAGTTVSTESGEIVYTVATDAHFSTVDTEVYVSITSSGLGSGQNVPIGLLTVSGLGIDGVFTTNEKPIVSGTDTESDTNYRYRLSNATLSLEKANEISVRLAALSVNGVSDVLIRKYARGIGTFDVMVIPSEGIATDSLVATVQSAIDAVTAIGMKGTAIKPSIVPVDIEVRIVFVDNTTEFKQSSVRSLIRTAIEKYIVNIPIGGTFVYNEMIQRIMEVDSAVKDVMVNCYYFREEPVFHGNVSIYWDEVFYPNTSSSEAIRVI